MQFSRRRVLGLVGTLGGSALAGCNDSTSNTDDESDDRSVGTNTPTLTPSTTLTPAPTETDTPTDRPSPTPTDTRTPTDRPSPTPTPTDTPIEYQQRKFAAADGDSEDQFGSSVALSSDGTTALVGAFSDEDPNGSFAGSAYVFTREGGDWSQSDKLAADDGDSGDAFGNSVALSSDGTTALIGSITDGRKAGSAYVFTRDGGDWNQSAKLTAEEGDSEDLFGWSVALSGDGATALISASKDEDPNGEKAGSAYVFTREGGRWRQTATLAADEGDSEDNFGTSVGLSSDGATALIGAVGEESAYVFTSDGDNWSQDAKLAPDDRHGDEFGFSVALSNDGTTGLMGAFFDDDPNGEKAGSAYVFTSDGGDWSQSTKLAADDGDSQDRFGWSVALSGDGATALISASRNEDPNGAESGSTYVFE